MGDGMAAEIPRIVAWLRDRVAEAGSTGCVVGLSGGIDSSVTAALCMRAFPETSLGVLMPYSTRDDDFTSRGRELAEALSMPAVLHPIGEAHESIRAPFDGAAPTGALDEDALVLPMGNLRSRLRMAVLYLYGNALNRLVVGTGNKDEDYGIGYFTKYGDGGVDLSPIADFHKSEVYRLGAALGVPERILAAPPSAGLWDGQTDEDELGMSYDEIEEASKWLDGPESGRATPRPRLAEVIERVKAMRRRNRHKLEPPPVFLRS